MNGENVVILGATSGIAQALARTLAARGCNLVLAGRKRDELERMAADLRTRYGVQAHVELFDALDFAAHEELARRTSGHFGGALGGVVLCYGELINEKQGNVTLEAIRHSIDVNFTSAATLLECYAALLAERRQGYIAAISSVAGDRGRRSNYVYGAAKAGLTTLLSGLRSRMFPLGVHVLTIKPGFVDTEMVAGQLNPNSQLVASPERVARDIDRAIRRRRNVVYTPWFWRIILGVVRLLPEWLFKRLKF